MDKETWGMIAGLVLVLACLVGSMTALSAAECNAKTSGMGFPHRWDFIGGCFVQPEEGKWIPLESYYFKEE